MSLVIDLKELVGKFLSRQSLLNFLFLQNNLWNRLDDDAGELLTAVWEGEEMDELSMNVFYRHASLFPQVDKIRKANHIQMMSPFINLRKTHMLIQLLSLAKGKLNQSAIERLIVDWKSVVEKYHLGIFAVLYLSGMGDTVFFQTDSNVVFSFTQLVVSLTKVEAPPEKPLLTQPLFAQQPIWKEIDEHYSSNIVARKDHVESEESERNHFEEEQSTPSVEEDDYDPMDYADPTNVYADDDEVAAGDDQGVAGDDQGVAGEDEDEDEGDDEGDDEGEDEDEDEDEDEGAAGDGQGAVGGNGPRRHRGGAQTDRYPMSLIQKRNVHEERVDSEFGAKLTLKVHSNFNLKTFLFNVDNKTLDKESFTNLLPFLYPCWEMFHKEPLWKEWIPMYCSLMGQKPIMFDSKTVLAISVIENAHRIAETFGVEFKYVPINDVNPGVKMVGKTGKTAPQKGKTAPQKSKPKVKKPKPSASVAAAKPVFGHLDLDEAFFLAFFKGERSQMVFTPAMEASLETEFVENPIHKLLFTTYPLAIRLLFSLIGAIPFAETQNWPAGLSPLEHYEKDVVVMYLLMYFQRIMFLTNDPSRCHHYLSKACEKLEFTYVPSSRLYRPLRFRSNVINKKIKEWNFSDVRKQQLKSFGYQLYYLFAVYDMYVAKTVKINNALYRSTEQQYKRMFPEDAQNMWIYKNFKMMYRKDTLPLAFDTKMKNDGKKCDLDWTDSKGYVYPIETIRRDWEEYRKVKNAWKVLSMKLTYDHQVFAAILSDFHIHQNRKELMEISAAIKTALLGCKPTVYGGEGGPVDRWKKTDNLIDNKLLTLRGDDYKSYKKIVEQQQKKLQQSWFSYELLYQSFINYMSTDARIRYYKDRERVKQFKDKKSFIIYLPAPAKGEHPTKMLSELVARTNTEWKTEVVKSKICCMLYEEVAKLSMDERMEKLFVNLQEVLPKVNTREQMLTNLLEKTSNPISEYERKLITEQLKYIIGDKDLHTMKEFHTRTKSKLEFGQPRFDEHYRERVQRLIFTDWSYLAILYMANLTAEGRFFLFPGRILVKDKNACPVLTRVPTTRKRFRMNNKKQEYVEVKAPDPQFVLNEEMHCSFSVEKFANDVRHLNRLREMCQSFVHQLSFESKYLKTMKPIIEDFMQYFSNLALNPYLNEKWIFLPKLLDEEKENKRKRPANRAFSSSMHWIYQMALSTDPVEWFEKHYKDVKPLVQVKFTSNEIAAATTLIKRVWYHPGRTLLLRWEKGEELINKSNTNPRCHIFTRVKKGTTDPVKCIIDEVSYEAMGKSFQQVEKMFPKVIYDMMFQYAFTKQRYLKSTRLPTFVDAEKGSGDTLTTIRQYLQYILTLHTICGYRNIHHLLDERRANENRAILHKSDIPPFLRDQLLAVMNHLPEQKFEVLRRHKLYKKMDSEMLRRDNALYVPYILRPGMHFLVISSNEELRTVVKNYFHNRKETEATYGPIESWVLSAQVTSLRGLFASKAICETLGLEFTDVPKALTVSLDGWDTSFVTDMSYMFAGCVSFNQSLSSFQTAKVINFEGMFSGCASFDMPLPNWTISPTATLTNMFDGATLFQSRFQQFGDSFFPYHTQADSGLTEPKNKNIAYIPYKALKTYIDLFEEGDQLVDLRPKKERDADAQKKAIAAKKNAFRNGIVMKATLFKQLQMLPTFMIDWRFLGRFLTYLSNAPTIKNFEVEPLQEDFEAKLNAMKKLVPYKDIPTNESFTFRKNPKLERPKVAKKDPLCTLLETVIRKRLWNEEMLLFLSCVYNVSKVQNYEQWPWFNETYEFYSNPKNCFYQLKPQSTKKKQSYKIRLPFLIPQLGASIRTFLEDSEERILQNNFGWEWKPPKSITYKKKEKVINKKKVIITIPIKPKVASWYKLYCRLQCYYGAIMYAQPMKNGDKLKKEMEPKLKSIFQKILTVFEKKEVWSKSYFVDEKLELMQFVWTPPYRLEIGYGDLLMEEFEQLWPQFEKGNIEDLRYRITDIEEGNGNTLFQLITNNDPDYVLEFEDNFYWIGVTENNEPTMYAMEDAVKENNNGFILLPHKNANKKVDESVKDRDLAYRSFEICLSVYLWKHFKREKFVNFGLRTAMIKFWVGKEVKKDKVQVVQQPDEIQGRMTRAKEAKKNDKGVVKVHQDSNPNEEDIGFAGKLKTLMSRKSKLPSNHSSKSGSKSGSNLQNNLEVPQHNFEITQNNVEVPQNLNDIPLQNFEDNPTNKPGSSSGNKPGSSSGNKPGNSSGNKPENSSGSSSRSSSRSSSEKNSSEQLSKEEEEEKALSGDLGIEE